MYRERRGVKAEERESRQRTPCTQLVLKRAEKSAHVTPPQRKSSSSAGILPVHPFPPAPIELGTYIPQLQDETDKPFSQEAGKIIISLSGESPKQKHRHTNMLGQKNQTRIGNFVLKTLYPHNIALRCSRSRTLKVGKNLLKACVWSVPPVLRAQTECAVCCIPAPSIHSRPQASLAQHNLTEGRRHQSQHGLEIKNSNNSCYLNSEIQQF